MPQVLRLYPEVAIKSGSTGDTAGFTLGHMLPCAREIPDLNHKQATAPQLPTSLLQYAKVRCSGDSLWAVQIWVVPNFFPVPELWTIGCTPLRFAVSNVTVTGLGVESKMINRPVSPFLGQASLTHPAPVGNPFLG